MSYLKSKINSLKEFLVFRGYQAKCRKKRGEIFKRFLQPQESDLILDLGGEDGRYIEQLLPFKSNVYIADIEERKLERAAQRGYKTIRLSENGTIPCEEKFFDIIFCSSVIEHVTVDKKDMNKILTNREFKKLALQRQTEFAEEIRRKSKRYFVQTPYKYFPLESHSRLPVILVMLPRKWQIKIIKSFRKFWFARTSPDWYLLTLPDMKRLFPEAQIVKERSFLFTKSLMAIKTKD